MSWESFFPSLLLTSLACSPWGSSGLTGEGVNNLCDSFALNIVKSSREPGTFSSYLLMLVMLRSRHQDKSLIPQRKALAGVMREQSFYGFTCVRMNVCAFVLNVHLNLHLCMYCMYWLCFSSLCQLWWILFSTTQGSDCKGHPQYHSHIQNNLFLASSLWFFFPPVVQREVVIRMWLNIYVKDKMRSSSCL